ncbi:hypothetical protein QJN73_25135, partial [Escherichia coli]
MISWIILRRIFVWHGSVLSKISSRLLLNFLFSIAVIFMLPWYTHLGSMKITAIEKRKLSNKRDDSLDNT